MSSRFQRWSFIAVCVSSAAAIAACSSSTTSTGQSGRPAGTPAPVEAAKSTFCDDLGSYVQVLDRYGRVFDEAPTTAGQLETAAAELTAGQDKVKASGAALADSISAANR